MLPPLAQRALWDQEVSVMRHALVLEDSIGEVEYVGGVDLSFCKDETTLETSGEDPRGVAGICVCDISSLEVVYEDYLDVELTEPYIPGYLAFRERGCMIELVKRMREKGEYFYTRFECSSLIFPTRFECSFFRSAL